MNIYIINAKKREITSSGDLIPKSYNIAMRLLIENTIIKTRHIYFLQLEISRRFALVMWISTTGGHCLNTW